MNLDLQRAAVDNKELSLGKLLVENLSSEHFDLSKYSDTYAKELERLVKEEGTKDLVAALKASLQDRAIVGILVDIDTT